MNEIWQSLSSSQEESMNDDTVRVAVRIRPLVKSEIERGCQTCIDVVPGESQIHIRNTDKAFTFNYVFSPTTDQVFFYNTAIKDIVTNIFQGYNVTILAYGQTGSGKTHSMGTDYSPNSDVMGVIPRAIHDIFNIVSSKEDWIFKVTVSFMELYQEQLYDLLSDKQRHQSIVDIREDGKSIKVVGVVEKEVKDAAEALECLIQGSLGRVTGATAMNAQSSRSHAIFTVSLHQQKKDDPNTATTAKFHLVDLAGSERSKKTRATGERFREGVNINKGLLALGNVISQLGDGGSSSYICYRDSKLTRLLQDSLGGNSVTLMIACVSPADYNLDETLSTLRYADRARKIKNKPIVNQDPKVSEINRLNKLVQELRLGIIGQEIVASCPIEHQELEEKNKSLQSKIRDLTAKLSASLIEIVIMHEKEELAEKTRERILTSILKISDECKELLDFISSNPTNHDAHRTKLDAIYLKILDIHNDQKKASEELVSYGVSLNSKTTTPVNTEEEEAQRISTDEIISESTHTLEYFDEKHEEHTMRQAERNDEVQNINKELAIKEELVCQLLKNSSQMVEYSKELQDMEQEIKTLQSEKEELLQALQHVQTNKASTKLAESRRKKLQELEKKIAELSRKCLEQNKVIKVKERQDQQIKNLTAEMQSLKQTRVRLIRQMRNESDRFAKWKETREKELNRLKDQDRKRVNEMTRLKLKHNQQETVFKRKMEEAFAVNKRLKEALDVQKKAIQRREKLGNNKDGIQNWVSQELEVLVSTVDAKYSLQKLMEDRASLTCQVDKLKNDANADVEEIAELSEFIDLRNAQITDLQQKILEADQENRANTRWQVISTMTDAKTALRTLFDITSENTKKHCMQKFEYNDLVEKNKILEAQLAEYKAKERQRRLSRQTFTLKESNHTSEPEIERLRKELELFKEKYGNLEKKISLSAADEPKPQNKKKVKKAVEEVDENVYIHSESSSEDDTERDPDWTKTPLYNRIQKLWNTTRNSDVITLKRSSDGEVRCNCKTKCSTRICSCRKNDISCNNCKCNPVLCQNRGKENLARELFSNCTEEEEINESSKRPRLVN